MDLHPKWAVNGGGKVFFKDSIQKWGAAADHGGNKGKVD